MVRANAMTGTIP
jgi:hypothetical protein